MTLSQTPRFSLSQWSSDSDTAITRSDIDDDNSQVETKAMIALRGLAAARPAAGVRERLYYASDTGAVSWDDGTAWHVINPTATGLAAIPFHALNAVTTGLKVPKFVAPANMTLRSAYAVLESGSGVTYRIYVNKAAITDIPTSGTVGTTAASNDFTDHDISAGDLVQLYVVNAGSSANDLSVTVLAAYR